ncbi:hypothetical protein NC651_018396 [Populus alba x Populus x berolinensis]|nr:hypothetical protein NC651_018396 [Populus alba x Populus x berolinensis]
MSFLKQILGDMKNEVSGLMMYSSCCPSFSEIFGYTACRQLSQMFLAVLFFHSSEYVLVAAIHGRSSVTLSSLLISKAYVFAMMFALLEYVVEIALFPGLKEYWWVSNLGLVMVIIGEITRKLAIVTAGQAFTHLIKVNHEEQHNLITHGVYRFVRHPSYTGFLICEDLMESTHRVELICYPHLVSWRKIQKSSSDALLKKFGIYLKLELINPRELTFANTTFGSKDDADFLKWNHLNLLNSLDWNGFSLLNIFLILTKTARFDYNVKEATYTWYASWKWNN